MVSSVSKLANPWKCDADGCGILRANDTNHWLILWVEWLNENGKHVPTLVVIPWNDLSADFDEGERKHACGIPCALKLAGRLLSKEFFNDVEPGKEVTA